MRAKVAEVCGVGGMAINFFLRFDIGGEPLPNVCSPASWYYTKLFPGAAVDKELSATTHSRAIKSVSGWF